MYMTKPKQGQKKLSENTGKTFFRNHALFYMQGVGIFTEITVQLKGVKPSAQGATLRSADPGVSGA